MTEPRKLEIVIADDHYLVRNGLAGLVNTTNDMRVVAEAEDGAQAVQLYARHRPDVMLMDTRMPVKDGIAAAVEILKRFPEACILMLSAFDGDADIQRALEAGVKGYALKSSSGNKLLPAIRAVANGKTWIPSEVAAKLAAVDASEQLTAREHEVLCELAKGLSNKKIAEAMNIGEYTVKEHFKHIFQKLQAGDRTEALMIAIQRGIIRL